MMSHTRHRANIIIRPFDSDYRRKWGKSKSESEKVSDEIMRMFNGKVADDSI